MNFRANKEGTEEEIKEPQGANLPRCRGFDFTIIVPVLNERKIIENALTELQTQLLICLFHKNLLVEVMVADNGSADGSAEIGKVFCTQVGWKWVENASKNGSIWATVSHALAESKSSSFLILPLDCKINSRDILTAQTALTTGGYLSGGFEKTYLPSGPLLHLYCNLQNLIRTRLLKNLVWTNGIFFRKEIIEPPHERFVLPATGFLEDIQFSDYIKTIGSWVLLKGPVLVSSRRYQARNTLRTIIINGLILLLYRTGIASPFSLKRFYTITR